MSYLLKKVEEEDDDVLDLGLRIMKHYNYKQCLQSESCYCHTSWDVFQDQVTFDRIQDTNFCVIIKTN